MIVKLVEVQIKPGHLQAYLASQEIWNRETARAPGYLGGFCGSGADDGIVWLVLWWRSRPDYDHWMATEHERIAALASANEHYDRVTTRVLEAVLPEPSLLPAGFAPDGSLEAADVQVWSETYRATAAIRTAVRLRLFTLLEQAPRSAADLAAAIGGEPVALERLLIVLSAMQLVEPGANQLWRNTGLATRTLVEGAAGYQGHMVLHSSRPALIQRWFSIGERLGLPPDTSDPAHDHQTFIAAMSDTAAAGQAEALVDAVDLGDCTTLLDVGGATGPYAVALCRAFPRLTAIVIDLPETVPVAERELAAAGVAGRIEVRAHDYRSGPLPAPVDAILFSNVLRGENPPMLHDILVRAKAALAPGGRVIVHDVFPEAPPAHPGLLASFFGLHLPNAANFTMARMALALEQAGFTLTRAERLPRYVIMNGVLEARVSG